MNFKLLFLTSFAVFSGSQYVEEELHQTTPSSCFEITVKNNKKIKN